MKILSKLTRVGSVIFALVVAFSVFSLSYAVKEECAVVLNRIGKRLYGLKQFPDRIAIYDSGVEEGASEQYTIKEDSGGDYRLINSATWETKYKIKQLNARDGSISYVILDSCSGDLVYKVRGSNGRWFFTSGNGVLHIADVIYKKLIPTTPAAPDTVAIAKTTIDSCWREYGKIYTKDLNFHLINVVTFLSVAGLLR